MIPSSSIRHKRKQSRNPAHNNPKYYQLINVLENIRQLVKQAYLADFRGTNPVYFGAKSLMMPQA